MNDVLNSRQRFLLGSLVRDFQNVIASGSVGQKEMLLYLHCKKSEQ